MRVFWGIYVLAGILVHLQIGSCSMEDFEFGEPLHVTQINLIDHERRTNEAREYVEDLLERFLYTFNEDYIELSNIFRCYPHRMKHSIKELIIQSMRCADIMARNPTPYAVQMENPSRAVDQCFQKVGRVTAEILQSVDMRVNVCDPNNPDNTIRMNLTSTMARALDIGINDGFRLERKRVIWRNKNDKNSRRRKEDETRRSADIPYPETEEEKEGSDPGTTETNNGNQSRAEEDNEKSAKGSPPDLVYGEMPYY